MSSRLFKGAVLVALFASSLAFAQRKKQQQQEDDAPIPYSDDNKSDEDERRKLPTKSEPTGELREETEVEQLDRERSRANEDDPSIGISLEGVVGAMLLDSPKAGGVQPLFAGGVRLTWEFTRTLSGDEFIKEMGFVDVLYEYTSWADGTKEVHGFTGFHYFTLAPAFALPLGKSPFSAYAQLGVGFNYNPSQITIDDTTTNLAGTKFLFQYGIGLRARPLVIAPTDKSNFSMRISFRFELTRFRRGYMDDTMVGGSVGITF
jgi:hypothetical protein